MPAKITISLVLALLVLALAGGNPFLRSPANDVSSARPTPVPLVAGSAPVADAGLVAGTGLVAETGLVRLADRDFADRDFVDRDLADNETRDDLDA